VLTLVVGAFVVAAPSTIGASTTPRAELDCQAIGATLSVAMAAFGAQNPHVLPSEGLLLGHQDGGPYLASWPRASRYFNFSIVAGKLMVSVPTSAKKMLFRGPSSCSKLKNVKSGVSPTTTSTSPESGVMNFTIPSESMEPTIKAGGHVAVSPLTTATQIVVGDILVFKAPPKVSSTCGDDAGDLISRAIGVPGDHLSSKGNTILVNGKALKQTWTHTEPLGKDIPNVIVPKDHYFVIGDNQSDSCDSRYWGSVSRSKVIGIVVRHS
jgi:signal peptidase I